MAELAVITGASRGIGAAIALRLARLGYDLLLLARDDEALREVGAQCGEWCAMVRTVAGDLDDAAYLDHVVDLARMDVEVLVNNAGVAAQQAVQDLDMADARGLMAINFDAVVALTSALLPGMIERRRGSIVNISSISGRHTSAGSAMYSASKHALNGFSGSLYEDVRDHGIKVSVIMPGFVDTQLTGGLGLAPANMITADDVADSVAYVLSASPHCCPTEIVLRPQLRP